MNRLLFRQRLNHLREDALRFQDTLCAYETTDAVRYPGIFEKLGLDMARQAEIIAFGEIFKSSRCIHKRRNGSYVGRKMCLSEVFVIFERSGKAVSCHKCPATG